MSKEYALGTPAVKMDMTVGTGYLSHLSQSTPATKRPGSYNKNTTI
jgi:hypothetical protein